MLIVSRDTAQDRLFADAVAARLEAAGAHVLERVHGDAPQTRQAIEALLARGETIDAIAAVDATSRWSFYDRFPTVGSAKIVKPLAYRWPTFLKLSNLLGVAHQTAIYAIIAVGMTLVIITGGIDLSVGSLVALAAVVSGWSSANGAGEPRRASRWSSSVRPSAC